MRNKARSLDGYVFRAEEVLLLDANIWLYLFSAPSKPSPSWAVSYSRAFKRMLDAKVRLAFDALVLSEYINRYCRIEFDASYRSKYSDFKSFRLSSDFSPVGAGATLYVRRILGLSQRFDNPFASADIERVLGDFDSGSSDINDGLLTETCRIRGWKFVTNDGDCTFGGIDVLTNNSKLLKSCK